MQKGQEVIDLFKEIAVIPHCSNDYLKLKEFLIAYSKKYGCLIKTDFEDNIYGIKGSPKVCLQAHYDMVCVGDAPNVNVYEDDGFLKAKNSTLGADNGIGIAYILYFIAHNKDLEFIFTSKEEIGLIGASKLKFNIISKNLLNLDSFDENSVIVGCAGDLLVKANITIKHMPISKLEDEYDFYDVSVFNLQGGHSGIDIDSGISNAIKELGYFLYKVKDSIKIVSFNGGEHYNSIPKSAKSIIAYKKNLLPLRSKCHYIKIKKIAKFKDEYFIENTKNIIEAIVAYQSGVRVYSRSQLTPLLSSNLGTIRENENSLNFMIFARFMQDKYRDLIKIEIESFFNRFGFDVSYVLDNLAWSDDGNKFSKDLLRVAKKYISNVSFKSVHAAIESRVIKKLYPNLNIATIGPNIYLAHSTKEKCEISSIFNIFKIIDEILKKG